MNNSLKLVGVIIPACGDGESKSSVKGRVCHSSIWSVHHITSGDSLSQWLVSNKIRLIACFISQSNICFHCPCRYSGASQQGTP